MPDTAQSRGMDTSTAQDVVTGYLDCWNESDDATRRKLIDIVWTADARSVDPIADVTGREAIDAMMAATQRQFPGHRFDLVGEATSHHDVVHWSWEMSGADSAVLLTGIDVAVIDDDGRIDLLVGFFA